MVEGHEILDRLNEVICDGDNRPYQDVRITHTVILDDPLPDPKSLNIPERSPSPSAERLQGGRIAPDEDIDETEGKSLDEINEMIAEREAKARATILEMVGDIPDVDVAPPENVLFVCKLNPVTTDDDLEIIFSRFGKIKSCEVIRDRKTGDSLQYAFVEFEEQKSCEDAYFKMDNVLIDDRRIHVDFSQSVAKIKWHGKGRGVTHYDERGKRTEKSDRDLGKGNYKSSRRKEEKPYRRVDDDDDNKRRRNTDRRDERRDYYRRERERNDGDGRHRRRSRSRSRDRKDNRGNRSRDEQKSSRKEQKGSRKRDGSYERSGRSRSRDRNRRKDEKERKRSRKEKKKKQRKRSDSDRSSSD